MEEKNLRIMIERFFNAELSVEEERELCRYLHEHDVPAELRKDKEAIIALCGEVTVVDLPAGAGARLEAMLDTLAQDEEMYMTDERSTSKAKRRILKVPRIAWHGAAAAVLLVVGYIFMDESPYVLNTAGEAGVVAEMPDVDTFDNPEEAMECFKDAFGDVFFALNSTRLNIKEIEATLEQSRSLNNKNL